MSFFPADDKRLRELILHIALRCEDWEDFHPALLHRMLFQADFLHFRLYGFPITGHAYRRGVLSPAPRAMERILRSMEDRGELEIREEAQADGLHVKRRPWAMREPDLTPFDGQEIAVVERVVWFYRRRWLSAVGGPDLLDMPWELAGPREEIPYAVALAGSIADGKAGREPEAPVESEKEVETLRNLAYCSLVLAT